MDELGYGVAPQTPRATTGSMTDRLLTSVLGGLWRHVSGHDRYLQTAGSDALNREPCTPRPAANKSGTSPTAQSPVTSPRTAPPRDSGREATSEPDPATDPRSVAAFSRVSYYSDSVTAPKLVSWRETALAAPPSAMLSMLQERSEFNGIMPRSVTVNDHDARTPLAPPTCPTSRSDIPRTSPSTGAWRSTAGTSSCTTMTTTVWT